MLQCSRFQHWFWRWTSISFKPTNLILLIFAIWTGHYYIVSFFRPDSKHCITSAISERSYFSLLIQLMIIVCTCCKKILTFIYFLDIQKNCSCSCSKVCQWQCSISLKGPCLLQFCNPYCLHPSIWDISKSRFALHA